MRTLAGHNWKGLYARWLMGGVVRADTLLDNLTVYEMLAYTAELKNPMSEPFEKKRAKVEMVIHQLGLHGCRGVRIGSTLARGISGDVQSLRLPVCSTLKDRGIEIMCRLCDCQSQHLAI